jgi:hypothetical protein
VVEAVGWSCPVQRCRLARARSQKVVTRKGTAGARLFSTPSNGFSNHREKGFLPSLAVEYS